MASEGTAASAESGGRAIRMPAVAGRFYPAGAAACDQQARELLSKWTGTSAGGVGDGGGGAIGGGGTGDGSAGGLRGAGDGGPLLGGLVPHAGWICSGDVAAQTLGVLSTANASVDLVVVFGAVHTAAPLHRAALDTFAAWQEPGFQTPVVTRVRQSLAERGEWFVVDDRFHRHEHAIEVELPLIGVAFPKALLLPIEVPAHNRAVEVGQRVAERVMDAGLRAVFLASSDLTHYGNDYGLAPAGVGPAAMAWARANDQRLLERVAAGEADGVVAKARSHHNACGAGAIAAMLSACQTVAGRRVRGIVLRQTSSYETLAGIVPQQGDHAVGYASVVVVAD